MMDQVSCSCDDCATERNETKERLDRLSSLVYLGGSEHIETDYDDEHCDEINRLYCAFNGEQYAYCQLSETDHRSCQDMFSNTKDRFSVMAFIQHENCKMRAENHKLHLQMNALQAQVANIASACTQILEIVQIDPNKLFQTVFASECALAWRVLSGK